MTTAGTPTYWQWWGLAGKVEAVLRQHPDGRAESWAWGRWVEIPRSSLPRYDETLADKIDEATALRIVADPELFDDARGPDPEAADAESRTDAEMAELRAEGLTYREIGERFGISRQRAQQRVKRAAG